MTLRHMRILVAVFQQGSVTKAAQALHLAQPSVSLALRELEDYYGVALFTRTGRQLLPTACGQSFYDYAVHVVSLVDEMETQMRNWDTLGTMRIGSTITIGIHLLPRLVRQLQAEFPDLKIEVKVCRASQVEQLILDNDIDLGLMEMQPEHPKLYAEPFLHDELQAIVPPQHALAAKENVTFAELADYPFLMREPGSAGRKIVEACLALNHLPCRPAWESMSTQAIVSAVAEGLGVAVLPQLLVERDAREGRVVMLPFREPLCRHLYGVYHEKKHLSKSMRRFLELCQALGTPAPVGQTPGRIE